MTIQLHSFPDGKGGRHVFKGVVTAEVKQESGVLKGRIPHLGVEATGADALELHAALVAACAVAYDRLPGEGRAMRLRWAEAIQDA